VKFKLISEYFINEYLLINKEPTLLQIKNEYLSKNQSILGHTFTDTELFFNAFTHKSFVHEVSSELVNNERLEFLGDSVLQMIVSEKLMQKFPELSEGELSKIRSAIVNEESLANIAKFYDLSRYLLLGKGELKTKGYERPSLVSNCFEAFLGAVFLDTNYNKVKELLLSLLDKYEKETKSDLFSPKILINHDAKSKLQEIIMNLYKEIPAYESVELTKKNSKEKYFQVKIKIKNQVLATEENLSKKKAMQILAQKTLTKELYKNL